MKIRIEDGKTIISTDRKSGEPINKTKVKGLTYREADDVYSLAISYKYKKYHIGNYKTIEEAKSIRRIADRHIEDGTFLHWLKDNKTERPKNKYGVKGLTTKGNCFQLVISYKQKKYFLGSFKSIEAARMVRMEAEKNIENGKFVEWIENRKNGDNSNE